MGGNAKKLSGPRNVENRRRETAVALEGGDSRGAPAPPHQIEGPPPFF